MNTRRAALLLAAALAAGCATQPLGPPDPAKPVLAQGEWQRTELYFALGPEGGDAAAAEARWRKFLDAEVTPRFPDGLSVIDVYGQWRGDAATPVRERSRLLVLLHPASAPNEVAIEDIRAAWTKLSGDKSVLRVTQPAAVSF